LSGPLKVLIVEDEPAVGRTIAHGVEACGCDAELAISAAAFRAAFERDSPDMVLLDLSLPGGDGIELLRYLAAQEARPVILIVSGFDGRVVEAAVRLGVELGLRMGGALTKPLTIGQLRNALAAAPAGVAAERNSHELCTG
jgi:DNA-binding response OmpR family regulator